MKQMNPQSTHPIKVRKPAWLRRKLPQGPVYEQIRSLIRQGNLHTVCQEAQCPNQFECFSQKTATFLIMGSKCTRNCRFCSIESDPTHPPDTEEPLRVAAAAAKMELRYVVITSVTRDDLSDGGASLFAKTICALRERISDVHIEVLIPDFKGDKDALCCVLEARPDVLNHNIETVPRLYPIVRPQADYQRSLRLLQRVYAFNPMIPVKSGIMLGLGETSDEIRQTMKDIYESECNLLTLGQYLQPSQHHLPVERFVTPDEFDNWKQTALEIGFEQVASGPFVRSSYHARNLFQAVQCCDAN
ncbi:lipoyl synthase [Desulfococcaceae bacterium HSG7]|nr:lipoyl synthase [Desulfococcaceae bacterium HSG7]